MAALLTSVLGDRAKIAVYVDECTQKNIRVLPPNVNESDIGFSVHDNEIRFGLKAVKNLGRGFIENIITERNKQKFTSFYDFCNRSYCRDTNIRSLENLIKSGALDGLGANRKQMLESSKRFLDIVSSKETSIDGQLDLFGVMTDNSAKQEPELPNVKEFSQLELLEMEKDVTGMYFSGHPLAEYDNAIKAVNAVTLNNIGSYSDGQKTDVFAMISKMRVITTKNNQQMAFVTLEDKYSSAELVVFPNILQEFGGLLQEGKILRFFVSVSIKGDEAKLICNSIQSADTNVSQTSRKKTVKNKGLYLRLPNDYGKEYQRAMQITEIFDGNTPLYLYFTEFDTLYRTPFSKWVSVNDVMMRELKRRIGEENVSFQE